MAQAQLDLARASSGTSVIKDGNPTAFEACSISVLLQKSMIPTECEGPARPFLELEEKWRAKILLRAGIFNGDHTDVHDICENHEKLLGKEFSARFTPSRRCCLWISHPTPKPGKKRRKKSLNPEMKFFAMTREKSQLLLEHHHLLVPMDGGFCASCASEVYKCLKAVPALGAAAVAEPNAAGDFVLAENIGEVAIENLDENVTDSDDDFDHLSDDDGQDNNPNLDDSYHDSQEIRDKRMEAINNLLEACGQDIRMDFPLTVDVNVASDSTISKKLKVVGAVLESGLIAMCKD